MFIFSKKAYTLLEIMLVLTILGILVSVLAAGFANYNKRWRDVARIAALSNISRDLGNYFQDFEAYPLSNGSGCLVNNVFATYVDPEVLTDPLAFHDNGCGQNGRYAYGMSASGLTTGPNEYVILSTLEIPNNGNYGGSIDNLTGTLMQAWFNNIQNLAKGSGPYYIVTK